MSAAEKVLSPVERKTLQTCEDVLRDVVARERENAIQGGRALLPIRDQRLYRVEYRTFEHYCKERWKISTGHAKRWIAAAKVAERVSGNGSPGNHGELPEPANERQARALNSLPEDMQRAVWEQATEGGQTMPTVERIRELGAKALAGLPTELKIRAIEDDEFAAKMEAQPRAIREGKRRCMQQCEAAVAKLRKRLRKLADVSDLDFDGVDEMRAEVLAEAQRFEGYCERRLDDIVAAVRAARKRQRA